MKDSVNLCGVLVYDLSLSSAQKRLLKRGETSGRSDDNLESIRKRFQTYQTETVPVIKYYGDLVIRISADMDRDQVFTRTMELFR